MDEEEIKIKMGDGVNTSPTSEGIYLLVLFFIIIIIINIIHSCRITCERSESARKWRIALYKSNQ